MAIAWHASTFGRVKVNARFFCRCMDLFLFAFGRVEASPQLKPQREPFERQTELTHTSEWTARKAHPVQLLLENTCRLSVHWGETETNGEK